MANDRFLDRKFQSHLKSHKITQGHVNLYDQIKSTLARNMQTWGESHNTITVAVPGPQHKVDTYIRSIVADDAAQDCQSY